MGAADVVPGVSGGTIAFITGIYEELINSLNSININSLKTLKEKGFLETWKVINGNFLVALFIGIGISIISLAKLITHLLSTYPVLVWSFFFGLIIASSYVVATKVSQWNIKSILGLLIGAIIAFYITVASPSETPESLWFIFLSGSIAICAMILPGISGSFILLLLGKYNFILSSLIELNIKVIALFALGCLTGLLSFSRILSWMFKKYHDLTIALLTGFMIGSLNKVWPWKNVQQWRINSHGENIPFIDTSVLPSSFEGDPYIIGAIIMTIVGFFLIIGLEKIGRKYTV